MPRICRTALAALMLLALTVSGSRCAFAATPVIRITSPQPEELVRGPDVTVCFETAGITFSPGGFNLHFVLDDGPFAVQYNPLHPHVFRDVAPGTHTVRVFAADRLHQAVPGTLAMVTFHVEYPDDENRPSPNLPLLTYNLPQGEYMGPDAADILLNFIVSGVELSPRGYRVQYYVDGKRFIATHCRTYPIKNLEPGYHSIRLELIDPKGRLVPGPFNSVERFILVAPDKTPPRWKPGQPPATEPVIHSIHGPRTSGQPWVAADEAERERIERQRRTVRTGAPPKPAFTVRRDEIPTQQTQNVVRLDDDRRTDEEEAPGSEEDQGEETRIPRRADGSRGDTAPRRVPMRDARTTAPRSELNTTGPLIERLQREANLNQPSEPPGTTTLRATNASTEGVTIERVEEPAATPAPDSDQPATEERTRSRGDRRPQNKIGNLPSPTPNPAPAEQPPAEPQPPEAGQPAETTEEGRSETR